TNARPTPAPAARPRPGLPRDRRARHTTRRSSRATMAGRNGGRSATWGVSSGCGHTLPATVACGGDANPYGIAAAVGNTTPAASVGPLRSTVVSPLLVIFAAGFGASSAAFLPRVAHRLAVGYADQPRRECADCLRPFPPGLPGWVRAGAACPCSGSGMGAVLA